jgi:hypothetical protein
MSMTRVGKTIGQKTDVVIRVVGMYKDYRRDAMSHERRRAKRRSRCPSDEAHAVDAYYTACEMQLDASVDAVDARRVVAVVGGGG